MVEKLASQTNNRSNSGFQKFPTSTAYVPLFWVNLISASNKCRASRGLSSRLSFLGRVWGIARSTCVRPTVQGFRKQGMFWNSGIRKSFHSGTPTSRQPLNKSVRLSLICPLQMHYYGNIMQKHHRSIVTLSAAMFGWREALSRAAVTMTGLPDCCGILRTWEVLWSSCWPDAPVMGSVCAGGYSLVRLEQELGSWKL